MSGAKPPRSKPAHRFRLGCWRLRVTRRSRRAAAGRMRNWMRRSHRRWRPGGRPGGRAAKENPGRTAAPRLGAAVAGARRGNRPRLLSRQIGQRGRADHRDCHGHGEDANVLRAQEIGGVRCSGLERDDFGSVAGLSVVIAREGGRSSSRKIARAYWMPRFRGA